MSLLFHLHIASNLLHYVDNLLHSTLTVALPSGTMYRHRMLTGEPSLTFTDELPPLAPPEILWTPAPDHGDGVAPDAGGYPPSCYGTMNMSHGCPRGDGQWARVWDGYRGPRHGVHGDVRWAHAPAIVQEYDAVGGRRPSLQSSRSPAEPDPTGIVTSPAAPKPAKKELAKEQQQQQQQHEESDELPGIDSLDREFLAVPRACDA